MRGANRPRDSGRRRNSRRLPRPDLPKSVPFYALLRHGGRSKEGMEKPETHNHQ
jgi:hypothetical protein